MVDPSPISANDYRKLLARQKWTHGRAAQSLGISERTSKVYASNGVPSGLAAVALRSLDDTLPAQPGWETKPVRATVSGAVTVALQRIEQKVDKLQANLTDALKHAPMFSGVEITAKDIAALKLGIEAILAERAAKPATPLDQIDDERELFGPPDDIVWTDEIDPAAGTPPDKEPPR